MRRDELRTRIEEIGIFPGLRLKSAEQALYAAETLYQAGIPVAEITMTVPGRSRGDPETCAEVS